MVLIKGIGNVVLKIIVSWLLGVLIGIPLEMFLGINRIAVLIVLFALVLSFTKYKDFKFIK